MVTSSPSTSAPGTDKTGMDFRRILPEIRCQSCLSPGSEPTPRGGFRPGLPPPSQAVSATICVSPVSPRVFPPSHVVSATICDSENRRPRRNAGVVCPCRGHSHDPRLRRRSRSSLSAIVRKEAWTLESIRHLRADAERRAKEGPWSVTTERPQGIAMDVHDFYSEASYWWPQDGDPKAPYVRRDGQTNPNHFVANKNALVAMSDAVFTLGTAAYLLDDPRYAQRATRDINTWFINPKTRMNPHLDYSQAIRNFNTGRGAGIVDGRVFIRAIQGMEFL